MHPFVYVADCRFMVFLWTCLIQMGDSPRFPRGTPKEGQSSAMACSASRLSMDKQVWLVVSTPLKNMLVSWDDDIPNIWKNKNVPNHQPDCHFMAKSRENHGKHQPE